MGGAGGPRSGRAENVCDQGDAGAEVIVYPWGVAGAPKRNHSRRAD